MKIPLVLCIWVSVTSLHSAVEKAPLAKWLTAQKAYRSAHAEFVQTRKLPALNKPLVSKGEMWAKRPDKFLWNF